jgi:oxepin-CoA hydrolase/3-oxo-5,6-dehydrosuberyl-CoA semialdehyde dehydrogenase
VIAGLSERLANTRIGAPERETTRMGALISQASGRTCWRRPHLIGAEAERVFGDPDAFDIDGADPEAGAFLPPMLYHCAKPDRGGAHP